MEPTPNTPSPTVRLQLVIADAIEAATEHRMVLDEIRDAAEQVIAQTERQRDTLQTGVLLADEIIATHRDLATRLADWTRSIAAQHRDSERDDA